MGSDVTFQEMMAHYNFISFAQQLTPFPNSGQPAKLVLF
jgi:hypothetical protein